VKLAVATICSHLEHDGRWWSFEPFVLELNVWAELFDELIMVAPVEEGPPPPMWAPYAPQARVRVVPYRRQRGRGLKQERTSAGELPRMIRSLVVAARQADALHARAPGSIGLVAILLGRLLGRRRIAKYAGQWPEYDGEPRSFRWQKRLLRSLWWGAPVTVYGDWPGQPRHVVPFFTSVMSGEQMTAAAAVAAGRRPRRPPRVLFTGRLSRAKNVHVLLAALARLRRRGLELPLTVAGDGSERPALARQAAALGLASQVRFLGAVPHASMHRCYRDADVLVLASQTEGWPKALVEAMAYGLVCIGSDRGLVPQLLGDGRGLTVAPGDEDALTQALEAVARDPAAHLAMGRAAAAWARRFTLDELRESLRRLMIRSWHLPAGALGGAAPR